MPSPLDATGTRPPQAVHEEEEDELDLPPLDGASDEDEHARAPDEHDEIDEDEAGVLGGEEAAGDLDPGVTLDIAEEGAIEGGEAARDAIDIGGVAEAFAFFDDEGRASDESGLSRDEDDDSPLDTLGGDDAGAGTGEDPAAFVDEGALPPLDADDGDGPPVAIDEASLAGEAIAPERNRWRAATGMGAQVPCWLAAASPAHVVAAGPTVLVARDGGRVSKAEGPEIDAVALAASEEAIFAVARKGVLFASVDGGDTWATGSVPWTAVRGALAIAATPGRLWICEGGALWSVRWSRRSRPEPPIQVRKDGVRAMIAAGSTLVILAERADDLVLERLRGDDEAPDAQAVPPPVRAALGDGPIVLAASPSGRALALLAAGAVHLSRDGGASFRRCKVSSPIAMAFAGTGPDAPLLALTAAEDRSHAADLLLVEAAESSTSRIAEIPGASGARASLVWDPTREVLWIACATGLIAYERSAQH